MVTTARSGRALVAVVLAAILGVTAVACGGDPPELTGYERDPAPQVGDISLPDLSNGGADFPLRADPGNLLALYFGYTNCPDYCPTTMFDLKTAKSRLDDDRSGRLEVAMATVDPDRDIPVLDAYVNGFVEGAHALGTDDPAALAAAAAPFGVLYDVSTNADGEIEVGHSTSLYVIDDQGTLVLTWPFGVAIEDMTKDLNILFDRIDG
jgi:protein SCO1/2